MKHLLFVSFLFVSLMGYTQISVGPSHVGKSHKFDKGTLEQFKKTKTIFVFSNIFERGVYEDLLEATWTVTPYEIVSQKEFDIMKYLGSNYSIGRVAGYKRIKTTKSGMVVTSLYTFFEIGMHDQEQILKKFGKLSPKKLEKKADDIIFENKINIARFYLFPDNDFVNTAVGEDMDTIYTSLYNDEIFFNYQAGMLKNYFQKTNQLLDKGEIYWMYEKDNEKELINLSQNTLYVPEYNNTKHDGWNNSDEVREEDDEDKLYKKYAFEYANISMEDLDARILGNEEFYYLRYVRMNTERFLQVVNAKTGDVIYRDYIPGLSYNIKPKHIEDLSKTIEKVVKKQGKLAK